jgi:hypothetical protein
MVYQIFCLAGGVCALIRYEIDPWAIFLVGTFVEENVFFYTMVSIYMLFTLVIGYLVYEVAKTCIGNYFDGKTTIERYGKSGGWGADLEDVWERIINSGIKNDNRLAGSMLEDEFDKLT